MLILEGLQRPKYLFLGTLQQGNLFREYTISKVKHGITLWDQYFKAGTDKLVKDDRNINGTKYRPVPEENTLQGLKDTRVKIQLSTGHQSETHRKSFNGMVYMKAY
ncbi:hypothetical protein XENOCAPTIV_028620 [Xenoophorus captivus]|uniref:Uncharacterized protein n=1 Tax=Xenoophorus captivus TaxID=1517983 RepID=A0ABV0SA38_9TELE